MTQSLTGQVRPWYDLSDIDRKVLENDLVLLIVNDSDFS
jgi:hypothetical protein